MSRYQTMIRYQSTILCQSLIIQLSDKVPLYRNTWMCYVSQSEIHKLQKSGGESMKT